MADLRARLDRLEAENDRDNQRIVRAQARISVREEEVVSLRQQILVSEHLADGLFDLRSHSIENLTLSQDLCLPLSSTDSATMLPVKESRP